MIDRRYYIEVKYFIETVRRRNTFDLNNLYNNIKTLNIDRSVILNDILGAFASYNIKKNIISCNYDDYRLGLFHELFHVLGRSSNSLDKAGFTKIVNNKKIGQGLDEGYTEVLTKRYFKRDLINLNESISYSLEVYLMTFLEIIIERDKMEYYYSLSSLDDLIKELNKYNKIDNINKFIKDMDILIKIPFYINKTIKGKKKVLEICNFLVDCYQQKIKDRYLRKEISKELYVYKLNNFIKNLYKNIPRFFKEEELVLLQKKELKKTF